MFSHRQRGPISKRLLEWRVRIFGVGAVLGLAGIFLDESWLVTAALVVLFGGVALKFIPDEDSHEDEEEQGI